MSQMQIPKGKVTLPPKVPILSPFVKLQITRIIKDIVPKNMRLLGYALPAAVVAGWMIYPAIASSKDEN
jgi:hypothetical protein